MRYSADWHDDALNVAPEERATVADLRLFLQEQNVTMHLHGNEPSDHVTIALYTLAEGLAHDWWRLFGGRDREISLIRHRGGFVVPDIRMSFDGAAFEITALQSVYQNPNVRFWAGPSETMTRLDAEIALGDFVEDILYRLRSRGVSDTSAALRWARVQASRGDPDEAEFCEAAGALDLDPYEIEEGGADLIETAAGYFSGETLTEFLAGVGSSDSNQLVTWIDAAERRPREQARLGALRAIAEDVARTAPAADREASWRLGYRRARAVHRVLDLRQGHRFDSFRTLAEKLGATASFELAGRVDGLGH